MTRQIKYQGLSLSMKVTCFPKVQTSNSMSYKTTYITTHLFTEFKRVQTSNSMSLEELFDFSLV